MAVIERALGFYEGHATAPAILRCGGCGGRKIDLRSRATFAIGSDGRLLCPSCWQRDVASLDDERPITGVTETP
jgi:hypothetical protein